MKMAFWADWIMFRKTIVQQLIISAFVALVVTFATGSLYSVVPTITLTVAISMAITVFALDERNDWEGFRISLPSGRSELIWGRMLFLAALSIVSVLIGLVFCLLIGMTATLIGFSFNLDISSLELVGIVLSIGITLLVSLLITGLIMPFVAKFGMTKAVRLAPVVFVFIFVFVVTLMNASGVVSVSDAVLFASVAAFIERYALLCALFLVGIGVAIYVVCGIIAGKLYEKREF